MILHIGGEYIVPTKSVILILDYEKAVQNEDTALFLAKRQQDCETVRIADQPVKSLIFTEFLGKKTLYYSPISSGTLLKRARREEGEKKHAKKG